MLSAITTNIEITTEEPILLERDLKVVAFKLQSSLVEQIKELCRKGYYVSVSETTRLAIIDLMSELIEIKQQGGKFWDDNIILNQLANKDDQNVPASVKIPRTLLDTMNQLIKEFNFKNRSKFLRIALKRFLSVDKNTYKPWINNS